MPRRGRVEKKPATFSSFSSEGSEEDDKTNQNSKGPKLPTWIKRVPSRDPYLPPTTPSASHKSAHSHTSPRKGSSEISSAKETPTQSILPRRGTPSPEIGLRKELTNNMSPRRGKVHNSPHSPPTPLEREKNLSWVTASGTVLTPSAGEDTHGGFAEEPEEGGGGVGKGGSRKSTGEARERRRRSGSGEGGGKRKGGMQEGGGGIRKKEEEEREKTEQSSQKGDQMMLKEPADQVLTLKGSGTSESNQDAMGAHLSSDGTPSQPIVLGNVTQTLKRDPSVSSIRQMFAGLYASVKEKFDASPLGSSSSSSSSQLSWGLGKSAPEGQRQRVSQRGVVGTLTGGMETDERALAMPLEELVLIWREDILPNFDDRIKTRWVQGLVYRGIPRAVRGVVWDKMLGNRLNLNNNIYNELLERCRRVGSTIPGVDEIALDLPRTHFNGKGVDSAQLLPVLQAVSTLKPEVGYVQGMSYLGAMFMVFMAPEEAFVCLGNLTSAGFFPDFLRMNLDSIRLRWRVFEVLLAQECSDLACHFDEIGLSADLYLTDWWFTLFAKDFPLSVASRVWDCYFLEGESFLFRVALGICQHLRSQLLNMTLEECSGLLSKSGKVIDEEDLFTSAHEVASSNRLIRDMLKKVKV